LPGGHVILLRVKVTCTDFASFVFILHVFNHDWTSLSATEVYAQPLYGPHGPLG
jgi:hypothetical protein